MRQIKLFFLLTLLAWVQAATANTGNNLYDGPEKITVFCDSAAIICDSFENYTLGALGPQSPHWDTWDGAGGEGIVTTEQAASGTKSMKIDFTLPGATQDVILLLGDSTSGRYLLEWKMYIPTGKKAYYNLQHDLSPHLWAVDVMFDANGNGSVLIDNVQVAGFKYQYDQWITVQHYIDPDNDVAYMVVDDTLAGTWRFSRVFGSGTVPDSSFQIAGVDFYPIDASYKFYVDDVQFVRLAAAPRNDFCLSALSIDTLFGQAVGEVVTSELYDNTDATSIGEPEEGYECFGEPDGLGAAPSVDNSLWFYFFGDGNRYFIETGSCGSTNYIDDGDTQIAIYEGSSCDDQENVVCDTSCSYLVPVLCNEDGPSAVSGGPYPAGDTLQTVNGRLYYLLVDGFNLQGDFAEGEFCLRVQRLTPLTYVEEATFERSIRVSPNPTTGITYLRVSLPEAADLTIRVTNTVGQQIMQRVENNIREDNLRIDLSRHARGLYFVELTDGQNRSTRRVVVE